MSRREDIAARLRGVRLGHRGVPSLDRKYLTPDESERMAEAVIELETTPEDEAEPADTNPSLSVRVLELAQEFDRAVIQIRNSTGDYQDGAEYEDAAQRLRTLVGQRDDLSLERVKSQASSAALIAASEHYASTFYDGMSRVRAVSAEDLATLASVYRNRTP